MADEDDVSKILYHCMNLCRQPIRHTSLSRVFHLLSTLVITIIVIEAIFLFSNGAFYISPSPILNDMTIQSSKNLSILSRSILQSPNISETILLVPWPNMTKTSDNTSKLNNSMVLIQTPHVETTKSSSLTLKEDKKVNATSVTIAMTSPNTTTEPPEPPEPPAVRQLRQAEIYHRVMIDYFTHLEKLCSMKPVMTPQTKKKLCPCISPFLEGEKPVRQNNIPTIGELELTLTKLEDGGHFRPKECHPRHRVSIIVPFRDREEHLNIFLNHMHPFLQRQLIEYRIFVVEEVPNKIFNKAMMMNIGFEEALKIFKDTDCIVFHDVDMLPENDKNLYACTGRPRHMGAFVDKWKYNLPYTFLVGGAISMTPQQFRLVNGYSNEFFGWGGEDDDFYQRVKAQGLVIERYPKEVSKYTMLKHQRDRLNPNNPKRAVSVQWRPKFYAENGLNSLKYTLKTIEYRPLYTWIQADIDMP